MKNDKKEYDVCSNCLKKKKDVKECLHPYELDVNNREFLTKLCGRCYYEAVQDI